MSEQPKNPIKGPKINFYWIYFIFGALVLYFTFFRDYQNVKQISYKVFRNEMLAKGHVEKLSGYKKRRSPRHRNHHQEGFFQRSQNQRKHPYKQSTILLHEAGCECDGSRY